MLVVPTLHLRRKAAAPETQEMDSRALLTSPFPCKTHARPPPALLNRPNPNPKPIRSQSPAQKTQSLRPLQSPSNPKKFSERDAFPDSLPIPAKNPHAVCKDIQRFARQGKLKEALTILDYLEHRGVPVNATTFSSLLSACARTKSLTEGRQIHVHMRINGLEKNEFLLTKLVQMYASCGSPEDAKRVFSECMPTSVYPWNAFLRGNVVGGRRWGHGTLSVFSEMRELGVDMNEYSFSCLIKSLAGSPSSVQGMKAHALLIKNGFVGSSVLLQTSLIDMYFKCGKISMALKLFDEIPERDIVLWGVMITGFGHNGLRKEALEYLRWMRSEGVEPNSVILTTILPVIGDLSELKLGQEVHVHVIKHFRNYAMLTNVQSGLIDMYCKCGDIVSARRVFYGSSKRNVVSWTALMSGYASTGRLEQALRSIIWMQQENVKPDVVSIATILPVCAELKSEKQGKEIHGFALKSWFLPNVSIATSLMTMYSSCGNLEYSCKVFEELERKNVIVWTAMIDSYLRNNHPRGALNVFRSMNLSKHRPDSIAMARNLRACGDLVALKLGKEIHGQVLRRKLEGIPFVSAEIMNMYGNCGEIGKAKMVFDGFESKGLLTWTSIIEAHRSNGLYRDALNLFNQMQSSGFVPNHFTFDVVLSICDEAELHCEALEVFDAMVRKYDLKASELHFDCIIGLLARAGRREEAQRFIHLKSTAFG